MYNVNNMVTKLVAPNCSYYGGDTVEIGETWGTRDTKDFVLYGILYMKN